MARGAQRFKSMAVPRQPGELARLRVLAGPDAGSIFVITAARVTIGRGEENDIILTDLKASRRHAELAIGAPGKTPTVLRDAGSSHGMLVNGVPQRQQQLKTSDKIGLGETVLEYIGPEPSTQMLVSPPRMRSAPVGSGYSGLTQFIPRPGANVMSAPVHRPSGSVQAKAGFLERNRKFMLILVGISALAILLPEVEQKQKLKRKKYADPIQNEVERSVASLPPIVDPKVAERAEAYFKEGFREFRARNYLRAQVAFETALQINAGHTLARTYVSSTRKAMEDEANQHFKDAKRDEEANRVLSARVHYQAVMRLFARDRSNKLYKEAESKMQDLDLKAQKAGVN